MAEPLPSIEPRGPISRAVRALVDLLAETEAFQEWVGAASPQEACAHIYFPHVPHADDDLPARPFAVVTTKDFTLERDTTYGMRPAKPQLGLLLVADAAHPDRPDWSQTEFENFTGSILVELAELQGCDDRLAIQSIAPDGPSYMTDRKRETPVWFADYTVTWSAF